MKTQRKNRMPWNSDAHWKTIILYDLQSEQYEFEIQDIVVYFPLVWRIEVCG